MADHPEALTLPEVVVGVAKTMCDENEGPGSWDNFETDDREPYVSQVETVLEVLESGGFALFDPTGQQVF